MPESNAEPLLPVPDYALCPHRFSHRTAGRRAPGSGRAIRHLRAVRRGPEPSRFCTIGFVDAAASPRNGPAPAPL